MGKRQNMGERKKSHLAANIGNNSLRGAKSECIPWPLLWPPVWLRGPARVLLSGPLLLWLLHRLRSRRRCLREMRRRRRSLVLRRRRLRRRRLRSCRSLRRPPRQTLAPSLSLYWPTCRCSCCHSAHPHSPPLDARWPRAPERSLNRLRPPPILPCAQRLALVLLAIGPPRMTTTTTMLLLLPWEHRQQWHR